MIASQLENIMLDRQGHIRLVDYGLCIEDVSPGNYVAKPHYVGTVGYLSPEVNFYPYLHLLAFLPLVFFV